MSTIPKLRLSLPHIRRKPMIKVAILTVSDSCSDHRREDVSGQTIKSMLPDDKFEVCQYKVVADEKRDIKKTLIDYADGVGADIVITTGGTGLGPRKPSSFIRYVIVSVSSI